MHTPAWGRPSRRRPERVRDFTGRESPSTPYARWTKPGRSRRTRSCATIESASARSIAPAMNRPVSSASSVASTRSSRRTSTTPARGPSIAGGGRPGAKGREWSSTETVEQALSFASASSRPASTLPSSSAASETRRTSPSPVRTNATTLPSVAGSSCAPVARTSKSGKLGVGPPTVATSVPSGRSATASGVATAPSKKATSGRLTAAPLLVVRWASCSSSVGKAGVVCEPTTPQPSVGDWGLTPTPARCRRRAWPAPSPGPRRAELHSSSRRPRAVDGGCDPRGAVRSLLEARQARPAGTRTPVTPSSTASTSPPTAVATTGPAVRHRLARDHAVALPARRDDDERGPLVPRAELVRRNEADGLGEERAERPVPDDDERQPLGRPRRAPARPSPRRVARRRGRAVARPARPPSSGIETPLGITRTSARPERARLLGERGRGADDDPGAAEQPPRERPHVPREGDVRAPELEHDRLARGEGRQGAREPVGVDDVRVAARAPRRARERREEEQEGRAASRGSGEGC